ncbi:MAG: hypothetical protein COA58_13320 [Bacteroidetes bacterium]|nr:MAG: hypothetical protein COA58_13320 [Bacteroidota bacterium]
MNYYRFLIFSQWGEKLVDTNDPEFCWNGQYRGKEASQGVYIWMIEGEISSCQKKVVLNGTVTLLR